MKHTRSVTFWCRIFILAALCWQSGSPLLGQTANGWGEIWQERMSIGHARLDEAFKLAESGKAADVYQKFDITTDAVVRAAQAVIEEMHGSEG